MFKEHFQIDSIPNMLNLNIWIHSCCERIQLLYAITH